MTYKDPKKGIIDLSSERLPMGKKVIYITLICVMCVCAVFIAMCAAFIISESIDPNEYSSSNIRAYISISIVFLCPLLIALFLANYLKKSYLKARKDVLEKIEHGELTIENANEPQTSQRFCTSCGAQIHTEAVMCPTCGASQQNEEAKSENIFTKIFTKFKTDKKLWIASGAIIALIVIIVSVSVISYRGSMKYYYNMVTDKYSLANCTLFSNSIKLDTNPTDKDPSDMSASQYHSYSFGQSATLNAIKLLNEELGFGGSLYSEMTSTTYLMGEQTEENSKYRVSWTYHPYFGLEVEYEKK